MKYIGFGGLFVTFFLLAACNAPAPKATGTLEAEANYWQQQGSMAGTGSKVSLASDGTSNTIAFEESDGTVTNIRVKKWTGTTWTPLGSLSGSNAASSNANEPSLALDSSGNPVVAWEEFDGFDRNIYVQRFNGSSWVPVGTGVLSANGNPTDNPSLALDGAGNPVVAWYESDGTTDNIYVRRFNGSSWVAVGSGVLSGSSGISTRAQYPSLALDSSGNPVVAWQEGDGTSVNIYVQRFDGSSWVNVGTGILNAASGNASYPSLALDSSGNPVVAWNEVDGISNNVYVQRWNGSAWVQYGAGGPLDITPFNTAYYPSLVLDNNDNPTVAWSEFGASSLNIYVNQWTGSAWTLVGTNPVSNIANNANHPSLSLVNGSLSVAWQEGDGGNSDSLYVKKYITNAWADLGSALDYNTGQSALNSTIARKSNNYPTVAWDEVDSGNGSRNVYVKEWSGSAWSLISGALDKTLANDAENPSLAMRSDNRPVVAWQEAGNIFVKRWNGTIWSSVSIAALDVVAANEATSPSLALRSNDNPVVAWYEDSGTSYDIYVKQWNGTAWVNFGTGAALDNTLANDAFNPSLALDSAGNPVVAWFEDAGTSQNVYVKAWNGAAWVALGTTLDKTVSRDALNPVLVLRSDNKPIVTWQEAGNVYVKRWNGSAWSSLGNTLDTTSGNEAINPSLDLRSDNNPVVSWQEFDGASYNVYVKRWTGSTWVTIGTGALDKFLSRMAEHPGLVLKSDNNPILSWDEDEGTSENILVKQF